MKNQTEELFFCCRGIEFVNQVWYFLHRMDFQRKGRNVNICLMWFVAGIILIVSEFFVPGFIICFFGVSALVAGAAALVFPEIPLFVQILIFTVCGVLLLLGCRRFMPAVFKGRATVGCRDVDADDGVGEYCICTVDITPDLPGKVEFRGSSWSAICDEKILSGTRCVVVSRSNLTLTVRKV